MKNFKLAIYFIIYLCVSLLAIADSGSHLYTSERLASNKTTCIIQDKYGFIWIGTEYGLNKFDGYRFTHYLTDINDSTSIISNDITSFLVDKKGQFWIGSEKGLMKYNYKTNDFKRYHCPDGNTPRIETILEMSNGDILIATAGYGLYKISKGTDKIIKDNSFWKSHNDDYKSRIFEDDMGNIWQNSHLPIITRIILNKEKVPVQFKDFKLSHGPAISFIKNGAKSFYIVCMYGILEYRYKDGTIHDAGFDMSELNRTVSIRKAILDSNGNILIGTSGKGMMIIPRNSRKLISYKDKNSTFDLSTANVNNMYEDKDKNIWISCYKKGIYMISQKKDAFNSWTFSQHNYLLGSSVSSIAPGHNGDIFVTIQKTGVYKFDKNGNITSHPTSPAGANTIYKDKQGNYWLCSETTLYSYNPYTGEYHQKAKYDGWGLNFILDGKEMSCFSDKFVVPYDENTFSLEFSLLNFKYTDEITFQYKINDNENWISIPEGTNAISFNKLKPGKYEIEVRATANGAVSKSTKKVTIKVLSPWYAPTLAWIIYIMVIATGIYLYARNYKRRKNEELEETKMRFLINATHDIRSPLTLILGPLNKLKSRLTDAESQNDIKTIDRNAQRLLLLVNQILDIRKIDKKQMHLHCEKTEMATYINDVCARFRYNADQHNIIFNFEHEAGSCYAWIDKINFDKIISNLLSNAFKFTPDGGSITIRLKEDEQHVTIDVLDTGMGFKNKNTDKLFERFYQEANSRGISLEGTGIGLNLSRTLTEMHGGTIKAANRTDNVQGAQITISIPKGNSHLKPEEIISPEDDNSNSMLSKKPTYTNCRMMVVDDDAEMRQYIKNEMSEWYKVDTFPNGVEALDALLKEHYDIVVSDIMMPEMDGVTLLKKIKTNSRINDIPVILLTSKSDVADRLESFKKGADAFLAKPFNMSELHILTDNLISNVRRLRGKYSGAQEQKDKIEQIEVKGNNDQLMNRIMKSINEHISDPDFNVESLAEDVGISRAQLHRKMKEITGISTGEFIRNLRLEQAARLIREQKINVTQVAYAVGFNNQTHFSTVFRKRYGMSPTEYAKKEHNENTEQKQES